MLLAMTCDTTDFGHLLLLKTPKYHFKNLKKLIWVLNYYLIS